MVMFRVQGCMHTACCYYHILIGGVSVTVLEKLDVRAREHRFCALSRYMWALQTGAQACGVVRVHTSMELYLPKFKLTSRIDIRLKGCIFAIHQICISFVSDLVPHIIVTNSRNILFNSVVIITLKTSCRILFLMMTCYDSIHQYWITAKKLLHHKKSMSQTPARIAM